MYAVRRFCSSALRFTAGKHQQNVALKSAASYHTTYNLSAPASELSPATINILKSTAPVLKEHGTAITKRFYEIMFERYPVAKDFFNQSHHRPGAGQLVGPQPAALANACYAYAANCDNLGVLDAAVKLMVHKHVSFNVKEEHYPIVSECMLAAIGEVLGEAATPEIVTGWTEGLDFLSNLLIGLEKDLAEELASKPGGWHDYKILIVDRKVIESPEITSFYLTNIDKSPLPEFQPGQYLSFQIPEEELEGQTHRVVRNYSLSCKSGENYYRISVKKESMPGDIPNGLVSNFFHDKVDVGTQLKVTMPCGTFKLKEDQTRNIVLIAGGVGLTPMLSMLETVMANKGDLRKVTFIQCARSADMYAMKDHIDNLTVENSTRLSSHVFYSNQQTGGTSLKKTIPHGRLTKEDLQSVLNNPENCEFYLCGPPPFIHTLQEYLQSFGVNNENIDYECFGPLA